MTEVGYAVFFMVVTIAAGVVAAIHSWPALVIAVLALGLLFYHISEKVINEVCGEVNHVC